MRLTGIFAPAPVLAAALLALALFADGSALAHSLSRSSSHWLVHKDGAAEARIAMPIMEIARAFPVLAERSAALPEDFLLKRFSSMFRLWQEGARCSLAAPPRWESGAGRGGGFGGGGGGGDLFRLSMRFQCPKPFAESPPLALKGDILFDEIPTHLHFLRLHFEGAAGAREAILTNSRRSLTVSFDEKAAQRKSLSFWEAFLTYIPIGITHILEGLDHLAFLLALLLLCRRTRLALLAVTGFTLGHSLTLGLAATDLLLAKIPLIEALIGFTILFAAAESMERRQKSPYLFAFLSLLLTALACLSWFLPSLGSFAFFGGLILFTLFYGLRREGSKHRAFEISALASFFGLIHGFGFASALQEFGLPIERRLPALFGFNLGVEIGQVALILLFSLAIWGLFKLSRAGAWRAPAEDGVAVALGGLGAYWFTVRLFS